jgi:hypothetical protein
MISIKSNREHQWPVLMFAGLLLAINLYVGAYFLLGEYEPDFLGLDFHVREFPTDVMQAVFGPAGWVEAKVRNVVIVVDGPDEGDIYRPEL